MATGGGESDSLRQTTRFLHPRGEHDFYLTKSPNSHCRYLINAEQLTDDVWRFYPRFSGRETGYQNTESRQVLPDRCVARRTLGSAKEKEKEKSKKKKRKKTRGSSRERAIKRRNARVFVYDKIIEGENHGDGSMRVETLVEVDKVTRANWSYPGETVFHRLLPAETLGIDNVS